MRLKKNRKYYKLGGSQINNHNISNLLNMDSTEYYHLIVKFYDKYRKYPGLSQLFKKIIILAERDPSLYFFYDTSRGRLYQDDTFYYDEFEGFASINRRKFNRIIKKIMTDAGFPHIDLVYFEFRERVYEYFNAYPDYLQGVIDDLGIVLQNPLLTFNAKIYILINQPPEKLNQACLNTTGISLDTFQYQDYIPQPLYPPPREDMDDEELDTRYDMWYHTPPLGDERQ